MLTLTKFKAFLDIPPERTEKDSLLQEFIDDAIGEADRIANRTLEFSEHTIYLDGSGSNILELTEAPVQEVTELKYWNGEDYTDLLDAGDTLEDIVEYTGGFSVCLKKNYLFCKGVLNIMVTFTSGYKWADDWKTNTAYLVDNLAVYNGNLYKCLTVHTSTGVFDNTKWEIEPALSTPADLEKAIKYNAAIMFYESPAGKNLFAKSSENLGGASSKGTNYDFKAMRDYYISAYESYRKLNS